MKIFLFLLLSLFVLSFSQENSSNHTERIENPTSNKIQVVKKTLNEQQSTRVIDEEDNSKRHRNKLRGNRGNREREFTGKRKERNNDFSHNKDVSEEDPEIIVEVRMKKASASQEDDTVPKQRARSGGRRKRKGDRSRSDKRF